MQCYIEACPLSTACGCAAEVVRPGGAARAEKAFQTCESWNQMLRWLKEAGWHYPGWAAMKEAARAEGT